MRNENQSGIYQPWRKALKGFTLVELIVVITILAILATVGFLSLSGYSDDARSATVKANVRTVYSAILTESTTTGNSPRYYVNHDATAALSGAFVFVDGKQVALTGGNVGEVPADSNYSAGNPRWDRLRMNGDKFKLAFAGPGGFGGSVALGTAGFPESSSLAPDASAAYSTGELAVGGVDVLKTGANGRKRATPYFQVAGVVPGSKVAVVSGNLAGGTAGGLIRNPDSTDASASLADGLVSTSSVPESCKAMKAANPSAADGTYRIDPDGTGLNAPITAYCDMTTDGGGWTILWKNKATGGYLHAPWFYKDGNVPTYSSTGSISLFDFPNSVIWNSTAFYWKDTTANQYVSFNLTRIEAIKAAPDYFPKGMDDIGLRFITSNITNASNLYQFCAIWEIQNPSNANGFRMATSNASTFSDWMNNGKYGYAYIARGIEVDKRIFLVTNYSSYECSYGTYGLQRYNPTPYSIDNVVFWFR